MKRTHAQAGFNASDLKSKRLSGAKPTLMREAIKPKLTAVKNPTSRPVLVGSSKNNTLVYKNSIPIKPFKPRDLLKNTSSFIATSPRTDMPNSKESSKQSWASKVLSRPHLSKKIPLLKTPYQVKNNSPVNFPTRRALEPSPRKQKSSYHVESLNSEKNIVLKPGLQIENPKQKNIGTSPQLSTKQLSYLGDFTLASALELAKNFGFTFDENINKNNSGLDQDTTFNNYQQDQPKNFLFQLQQLKLQRDILLNQQKTSDFISSKNLGDRNEFLGELNTLIDIALINSDRVFNTLRQPIIHQKALRIEPSFQKKFSDLFKTIDGFLLNHENMDTPYGFNNFQNQRKEKIFSLFNSISQLSATLRSLYDNMHQFESASSTLFSGESSNL